MDFVAWFSIWAQFFFNLSSIFGFFASQRRIQSVDHQLQVGPVGLRIWRYEKKPGKFSYSENHLWEELRFFKKLHCYTFTMLLTRSRSDVAKYAINSRIFDGLAWFWENFVQIPPCRPRFPGRWIKVPCKMCPIFLTRSGIASLGVVKSPWKYEKWILYKILHRLSNPKKFPTKIFPTKK